MLPGSKPRLLFLHRMQLTAHMDQQMPHAGIHDIKNKAGLEPKPENKYRKNSKNKPLARVDIRKNPMVVTSVMAVMMVPV